MKGISSKAVKGLSYVHNAFKFNGGSEFNEDLDVNLYETPFRNYNAQIGRFHGLDKLSELTPSLTPNHFGFNNPLSYNDPTGLASMSSANATHLDGESGGKQWKSWNEMMNYYYGPNNDGVYGGGGMSSVSPYDWYKGLDGYAHYDARINNAEDMLKYKIGGKYIGKETALFDPVNQISLYGYNDGTVGGHPLEQVSIMARTKTKQRDWLTNMQTTLGAFDVSNGAKMELINYTAKYSPSIKNLGYVKGVEVFTKGVFIAQVAINTYNVIDAFSNDDPNKCGVAGKSTLDITVGAISAWTGPIGWAVGGVYFIGDAAGWWGDWGEPENRY